MIKKNYLHLFLDGPLLDKVKITLAPDVNESLYPFSLAIIKNTKEIRFPSSVTFFVGENGSGKSTLLEAIALHAGFGPEGGSKNISFETADSTTHQGSVSLASSLTLTWRYKPHNGYFFRAESFFGLANYMDNLAKIDARAYDPYGGKSLHAQSHGESFMAFFKNRLGPNEFFILDEPEAALSPQRQLTLLVLIHDLCKNSQAQFLIATHSPILLAYPGATIYSCDDEQLRAMAYKETFHYQITKRFLNSPEEYLRKLLE